MTHVLLDKDLESQVEIRNRLSRWGITVGETNPGDSWFQWPSILECDLVIMAGKSGQSICKGASPAHGDQLAPVILLGVSGPFLLVRDAWQALPQINPDSDTLRLAVQTCLDQVGLMRHVSQTENEREDFLSFLGHEMRSPLTAAKTALEVLQGDLGGSGDQMQDRDPQLKMLEIALRSVRRLHHTMEWSQDLMGQSSISGDVVLQDVDSLEWSGAFQDEFPWKDETSVHGCLLHTDPKALAVLLNQVGRALDYASPDNHKELSIEFSGTQSSALCLVFSSCPDGAGKPQPRVSRLGLVTPGLDDSQETSELERLMRFVVSRVLVANLGVDMELREDDQDRHEVLVWVPLVPDFSHSGPADIQLLPAP